MHVINQLLELAFICVSAVTIMVIALGTLKYILVPTISNYIRYCEFMIQNWIFESMDMSNRYRK